jgi:hypothetical protein
MGYSERVQQQLHHEDGVGSGRCDNSERGLYGLFHVMTFKVLEPVNKATGQEDIVDLDSGLPVSGMDDDSRVVKWRSAIDICKSKRE